MDLGVGTIEILLLVAAIVAMLARRFHMPYSVGLVIAGIALSLLHTLPPVRFSRELVFTILLPPLIFEAAFHIHWQELRKDYLVILMLVSIGVLLSACVTTLGLRYVVNWEWSSALLFSVLIAATDPVSVIALFKESETRSRLRFLMEAESLFNDGSAAVLFTVATAFVLGRNITPVEVAKSLVQTMGGGILCGAVVAITVLLLAGRTVDHLVETTLTTVAAYGSFLVGEHFRFSGVLATLAAGLILGNVGPLGALSPRGREAIETFWEYAAFVSNSFIFLLIGMNGTRTHLSNVWPTALMAILLVIAGRAIAVYLTLLPFAHSTLKVDVRHQHILFWGGLRGALALALALGLPLALPRQEEIITVTFTVVAFSVFVQGLTVVPLLRFLGELPAHRRKG